jgi:hypothetical protein
MRLGKNAYASLEGDEDETVRGTGKMMMTILMK